MWADPSLSVEACALSTMAWGGMQRGNARRAWAARQYWLALCQALRDAVHTRETGFEAFLMLRRGGRLPGMGPAYFTKLLFFAIPKADAYILDQWTARSIHTLTGQGLVPPIRKDYVSAKKARAHNAPSILRVFVNDRLNVAHYVAYCEHVEQLASRLDWCAHHVEERLFSNGGKSPHEWRAHVMTAWKTSLRPLYA